MRIQGKIPLLLLFTLFLAFIFNSTNTYANGTSDLRVDFNVTPSQEVIVKPVDGNAKASLDFHINPIGEVKETNRPPIDVVFVFDKSGSMNSTRDKMQSAKDGLTNAVQFFEKNKQRNDRFSLITFSSDIETILPLSNDLDAIKTSMLHTTAYGGTNYTDPLRAAKNMLKDSKNEKYIVFLTDGQPMIATSIEKVGYKDCKNKPCNKYEFIEKEQLVKFDYQDRYNYYYNKWLHRISSTENRDVNYLYVNDFSINGKSMNSGWYIMDELEKYSEYVQALIKQKGLEVSKEIYNDKITMHTLGYGEGDLDDRYLEMLAQQTSGSFIKASEGSVSDAFEKLANKLNSVKLDGEIVVQLPENVTVDQNQYKVMNNKVYLPFSTVYEVGQGVPTPITVSLPVEFSNKGSYTFKDLKVQYKTAEETEWRSSDRRSVTIEVKDDAPASVTGRVDLNKINQDLFNLIIEDGKETNTFTGLFKLDFGGLVNPKAKGDLSEITIHQPLPEGISVKESPDVTIQNINGQQIAIIKVKQKMSFENGAFTKPALEIPVTMNAVWAINNVKMPQAKVYYVDSRYGNKVSSNLSPNHNEISAKVRTRQLQNGREFAFDGYSNGTIKKVKIQGQTETVVATLEAGVDSRYPIMPVKSLQSEPTQLTITYKNGATAVLPFVPELIVKDPLTETILDDGSSVSNEVEFYLSNGIPGGNVSYHYQLLNEEETNGEWTDFELEDTKIIDRFGKNEIRVKAVGGFAIEDYIIERTIWIEGDELIRVPSLIELYVGETQSFNIDIFPFGKPNNNYNVKVLQGDDGMINSSYSQVSSTKENRMTGLSPGEDLVEVETKNGKYKKSIRVIVKSRIVKLESMDFTKSKYTLLLEGNAFDIHSHLVFNPENATNKNIKNVVDTGNDVVDIVQESGVWKVIPKNTGVTTITVTSEEDPDIKAIAIFEVVAGEEETENPETGDGNIDGRW
ncbi:VWA domain-containing protein [Rossellomorea aquimaris]|uniref:von Willebrand factor type A domain-containing protein n=1 Tax=Rossellomorea aquimaris TaxID=189382 RepID=A0A366EPJ7_9BACI|nr:vWA domain-containing protein [Rossellomorea aquimaris]RBP04301.1 von Willebrand factor type A domain-containing protein [Rossellomorea aquimaris]